MPLSRFLNPQNDAAFKKLFRTPKNKDLLISFLNETLDKTGPSLIKEIVFLNPDQPPEVMARKQSILDVLCTDETGAQYIVEMQIAKQDGFEKRAQYYASKAYCSQMKEGEDYENLKEVIFLGILSFAMFPEKKAYKSKHVTLDHATGDHNLKGFSFTFIELPKFAKKFKELKTNEDFWLYFFKHAKEPEDFKQLVESSNSIIKKACNALQAFNWTELELREYDAALKAETDARVWEFTIRREGKEEGIAEGIAEGLEKGIAQGLEKGIAQGLQKGKAEGVAEGKLEAARNALKKGLSVEDAAEITGLSSEQVRALQ